jgi:peroxiredoxin
MWACQALLVLTVLGATGENGKVAKTPIAEVRLQDPQGNWHGLPDRDSGKIAVLAFLGVECPLADAYADRLAALAKEFGPRGVAFLGIDANQQDAPSSLARFAQSHSLPFPLLKDVGNEVADRLGAERTPEVVVVDASRVVRYRGRIDDQFAFGVHRPSPARRDLAIALDELLAKRPVSVPSTTVAGCRIGRRHPAKADGTVTYSKQIARILNDRCVSCHREGEIAPFALTSYRQAAGWAETIAEVVDARRMPPWHASPDYGRFLNDARLSDDERRLVAAWAADGAPEGDPADLPQAKPLAEGWRIPKPDLVVEMPEALSIPADGIMAYQNVVIDPKLKNDVWVRASQVRPGNPAVVHHVVVYVIPPGRKRPNQGDTDFLAVYAPGMPPRIHENGLAKFVPAGSHLFLQLHYTPRGIPQTDRTRIGLTFTDPRSVRKKITSTLVVNAGLRIPPGEPNYGASAEHRFDQDMLLYSIFPHMHLRGKSMRVEAAYPDGREEVLLDVPHYEFDWQNAYELAEPRRLPEGTVIRCFARFDNSAANLSNPDPNVTVTWGEQTHQEMLVASLEVALADQDISLGGPTVKPAANGWGEVMFHYRPTTHPESVYLAGTFNDWKPNALKMDGPDASGVYSAKLGLKPGEYEYKFVLDGKLWRVDPGNHRQVSVYHNSVLTVAPNP